MKRKSVKAMQHAIAATPKKRIAEPSDLLSPRGGPVGASIEAGIPAYAKGTVVDEPAECPLCGKPFFDVTCRYCGYEVHK